MRWDVVKVTEKHWQVRKNGTILGLWDSEEGANMYVCAVKHEWREQMWWRDRAVEKAMLRSAVATILKERRERERLRRARKGR